MTQCVFSPSCPCRAGASWALLLLGCCFFPYTFHKTAGFEPRRIYFTYFTSKVRFNSPRLGQDLSIVSTPVPSPWLMLFLGHRVYPGEPGEGCRCFPSGGHKQAALGRGRVPLMLQPGRGAWWLCWHSGLCALFP